MLIYCIEQPTSIKRPFASIPRVANEWRFKCISFHFIRGELWLKTVELLVGMSRKWKEKIGNSNRTCLKGITVNCVNRHDLAYCKWSNWCPLSVQGFVHSILFNVKFRMRIDQWWQHNDTESRVELWKNVLMMDWRLCYMSTLLIYSPKPH